jgi:hypothetical protein
MKLIDLLEIKIVFYIEIYRRYSVGFPLLLTSNLTKLIQKRHDFGSLDW